MDAGSIISSSMLSDASKKVAHSLTTSPSQQRAILTPRSSIVGVAPAKRTPATATPQATGAATASDTSTSTSTADAGDITSNDFLTLLVTEMQNQDPTQPTDPNAYIQQLVGVNSLQQLIAINNDLSAVTGTPGTSSAQGVIGGNGTAVSALGAATSAPTSMLYGTTGIFGQAS